MVRSDYTISIQPEYVLVERPEDYGVILREMPAMLSRLSAVCEEVECRKVLIRGSKTHVDLETLDVFDLGEQIAEVHLQIAVVEHHDASDEDESLLETVASNRGGPLRFFSAEKEAKDWLGVS